MPETGVWPLGQEDPLEKGMATHSSILAWETPWTEEPGGLQSKRSQRFRHNWATEHALREEQFWEGMTLGRGVLTFSLVVLISKCMWRR